MSDRYATSTRKDEYKSVDVICKYEDARKIICELVTTGYDIAFINELANPEWDNYTDAFVIGVFRNEIWCEPVKRDSGYVSVESDVVYIFSDCNSKIIPKIESDEIYEVEIGNDECNGDCENCNCHDIDDVDNDDYMVISDDNDKTHGFTVSRTDDDSYMSCSFYSSDELSHDNIQKMLKSFGF